MSPRDKTELVEPNNKVLSISQQLALLNLARSTYYYKLRVNHEDEIFMREIDAIHTEKPFYGTRKLCKEMQKKGYSIGRKRMTRLLKKLGIKITYPKPKTSISNAQHKKYPYLLKNMKINKPNQVWATDITYIKLSKGWIYLVAIIDWHSRYVISWEIATSLDSTFCIRALESALRKSRPEIFNSDQGVQFTSKNYTNILESNGVQISMDGKGSYYDNIFVERLWRTIKYEEVYLKAYGSVKEAYDSIKKFIHFYNHERFHQALDYKTPSEVYGVASKFLP